MRIWSQSACRRRLLSVSKEKNFRICVAMNRDNAMQFSYSLSNMQPGCLWLWQCYHSKLSQARSDFCPAAAAPFCNAIAGRFIETGYAVYKPKKIKSPGRLT